MRSAWAGTVFVLGCARAPVTTPAAAEPIEVSVAQVVPNSEREPAPPLPACRPDTFIDDGEDADNQHALGGYWFSYADSSGSSIFPLPGSQGGEFTMQPGGYGRAGHAARIFGVIANTEPHFAGMGLSFVDPRATFDASAYHGVTFFAKGMPSDKPRVRVTLPDVNTDPDGRSCSECFNGFGLELKLGEDWQPYTLLFSELEQEPGWGNPRPDHLETSKLYGMQFQVSEAGPFDVFVAAPRFVRCRQLP